MHEQEAIALLKKYSTDEESFNKVLAHVKAVQKLSLELAEKHPEADKKFIKIASLLHDIGRFQCPPGNNTILHGIKGAEILIKEGYEEYAKVAETHLGAGIGKEDIEEQNLPLPKKDFIPITIEEKIICHADSRVKGSKIMPYTYPIERFKEEINQKTADKAYQLYKEVEKDE